MNVLQFLFRKTLNSVIFGVALMVLVGLYIAVGSGLPGVREYFELNDLQFFNAWPLKVLMVLLVMNLCVVTWMRIPLTWPRLGVWMIHAGIITLIFGTSFYYKNKVEGQVYIHKGETVTGFYDSAERALFIRVNGQPIFTNLPLKSLPRYEEYPAGQSDGAFGRDLKHISLATPDRDDAGLPISRKISDFLGMKDDLTVDVIGYHPFAEIQVDYANDPSSNLTGVQLSMPDPHAGKVQKNWLVPSDPSNRVIDLGGITVESRELPAGGAAELVKSGQQIHRLDVKIGDFTQTLFVTIGQKIDLGKTGYSLSVESFNPAFPMSGTGELVRVLTLDVKNSNPNAPAAEFRRMVIDGKPLQTDFKLNEPGTGPMGKRQKAPIDDSLQILYAFNDPNHLLPQDGSERHILFTSDQPGITHVVVGVDGSVKEVPLSPAGEFSVGPEGMQLQLAAEREDHLHRREQIVDVPPVKRARDLGTTGVMQVATLRITSGDWSKVVNVPFIPFAMEPTESWAAVPAIDLPGTPAKLQIALGNTRRELPARLTLEDFELVNYPGGTMNDTLFRDFKSRLRVVSRETGEETVGVAHMNSPVYFDGGNWLFFQSGYNKQEMSTFIGIGNRPGLGMMMTGCVTIAVGLMYAFYLKPVIIRRRKQRAIAIAQAAGRMPKPAKSTSDDRTPVTVK